MRHKGNFLFFYKEKKFFFFSGYFEGKTLKKKSCLIKKRIPHFFLIKT